MPSLANRKVLVLNRGWAAIAVVSAERAICLCMGTVRGSDEPKARIIDPVVLDPKEDNPLVDYRQFTWKDWSELKPADGEDRIRCSRQEYRIPEVILLSKYNKLPQQRVHFSRRTIYRRDGNQCMYCGKRPGAENCNIDHIVPRKHGGETTWTNCVLSCVECNSHKADLPPKSVSWMEDNKLIRGFEVYFLDPRRRKVTIRQPVKPEFTLFKTDYRCESWRHFGISEAYWSVELQNDNKD